MKFAWRLLIVLLCVRIGILKGQKARPDYTGANSCGPGKRRAANSTCVEIDENDVMRGIQWVGNPSRTSCQNEKVVDGISVCEDDLPADGKCTIWSITSTLWCEHMPDMKFERYWSQRCDVNLYHFYTRGKSKACTKGVSGKRGEWPDYPRMKIKRLESWGRRCAYCFWLHYDKADTSAIDVLKIQELGSSFDTDEDSGDNMQLVVLSDFFMLHPTFIDRVGQLITQYSINSVTLMDSVGREAEMNFNMWAISALIAPKFSAFSSRHESGTRPPKQYKEYLSALHLDPAIGHYHFSYKKVKGEQALARNAAEYAALQPQRGREPALRGDVPPYCEVPSSEHDREMQDWITRRIREACHPTRLWVPCLKRSYLPILPCPKDLMNAMAEDFAHSKGWCDYKTPLAEPVPLQVPEEVERAFQRPPLGAGRARLAFFLTVYTDARAVQRLLMRVYSPDHYYLLHVDAADGSESFEDALRKMCAKYDNVFLAKDVIIVYGASTATILLTRAMAWFHHKTSGWDYFVPITGADYPLVPVDRMEKILAYQDPPAPLLMAWSPMASRSIFRLQQMHPIFEKDANLKDSFKILLVDRGKGAMGTLLMESRSFNFGPPLTCEGQKTFYHLDSRRNMSQKNGEYDTQWLFPRDPWPRKGYASVEEVDKPVYVGAPAADKKFR